MKIAFRRRRLSLDYSKPLYQTETLAPHCAPDYVPRKSSFGRRLSLNYSGQSKQPAQRKADVPNGTPRIKNTFGRRLSLNYMLPTKSAPPAHSSADVPVTKSTFGRRSSLNFNTPKMRTETVSLAHVANGTPQAKRSFGKRMSLNYILPTKKEEAVRPPPLSVEAMPPKATFGRRFSLNYKISTMQPDSVPFTDAPVSAKKRFGRRLSLSYVVPANKSVAIQPPQIPHKVRAKSTFGRRMSLQNVLPITQAEADTLSVHEEMKDKQKSVASVAFSEQAAQHRDSALSFFRLLQNKAIDGIHTFFALNAVYYLKDTQMEFLSHEALQVYRNLSASFPDYELLYESIVAAPGERTVVLKNAMFKMTHTGSPFSCMEPYLPIAPSGKYLEDGPMDFIYNFDANGKIDRLEIDGHGSPVGHAAIYTKLGGTLF